MGRLFWKFLMVFWLAFLAAGAATGTMVWLRHEAERDRSPQPETEHAEPFIGAAGATLNNGGINALRGLLRDWEFSHHPPVLAVNENGADLLGREVTADILAQAKQAVADGRSVGIRQLTAEDGHTYLIFTPPSPQGPFLAPPHGNDRPPHKPPSPAIPILSGVAASFIFSALLAWYFARPIRNLRSAFDTAAKGNLDIRVGDAMGKRRDELADLGQHFDRMAGQLKQLMDAQQRLLHDVSHELRSPLARMQAAIGLAYQQPDKITLSLQRIEQESQRMDDLVEELLTLSRLEAGVPGKMRDEIELDELLADIISDVRFEAERKQVKIDYGGFQALTVKGQSELIHRAFENILRNAIQHSEAGGTVSVLAAYDAAEGQFTLTVTDQGSGVPEAELAMIFEPFFKGGKQSKEKSSGLGLSIARRAIEAHHGSIGAANQAAGGLRIEIRIPFTAL